MFKNKKNIIFKVFEITLLVLFFGILLIVISPMLPFKEIPRTYIVTSGSMEPTIMTGSVVLTIPIKTVDIKVGDVIAFQSPSNADAVILHRVYRITSNDPITLETKGDNNNAVDNWQIFGSGVKGKEVFALPFLGYAGSFVRKPTGFFSIIVLPAIVFIIMQILAIRKAINEEVEKKVADRLSKQKDTITKLTILLFIFSSASLYLFMEKDLTASALFNDTAFISGITLQAKGDIINDHNVCNNYEKDEEEGRNEHYKELERRTEKVADHDRGHWFYKEFGRRKYLMELFTFHRYERCRKDYDDRHNHDDRDDHWEVIKRDESTNGEHEDKDKKDNEQYKAGEEIKYNLDVIETTESTESI